MNMETNTTPRSSPATSATRPPKGLRQKLGRMLAGVIAMPDGAIIPTRGGLVPKSEMVNRLAAAVGMFEAVDAQLNALQVARVQLLGAVGGFQELHAELQASVSVLLGRRSPELAFFGIKPHADRRPLNSEQRVVRAEKARQTRRLRHTKGSRQKAAIKFTGKVDVNAELRPAIVPPTPGVQVVGTAITPPPLLTNGHGPAG
jgi:hypothetical protein